jgi:transposase
MDTKLAWVSSRLHNQQVAEVIVAKRVAKITLGIDVAKDQCVICNWETNEILSLPNQPDSIAAWLRALPGPLQIALEPTSHYHLGWVEAAQTLGHAVYLINPRQLAHYREAVNVRNKTDPQDAWLLARYLVHEGSQLRAWQPPCQQAQRLWALLKRRALSVTTHRQLQQSFGEIRLPAQALFTQFQRLLARIDQQIHRLIQALGWNGDYRRCLSIPGIGPINAAALVAAFHRGSFANSDAFIAFLGMDVRLRESGRYTGKRKLTKRGEAELRRLLYCAAQPARSYLPFEHTYQRQLDKGLPKIAAKLILARKLARIAFSLMNNQQMFVKKLPDGIALVP